MAKVKYIGPNSDVDKRTLDVTDAEADRLEAGGLWRRAQKRKTKKEGDA